MDTVYHCAARPGVFGPARDYERANVDATARVIEARRAARVPRLVFTSSPSVVFDGGDHVNAGPDLPYPERYLAHYPRTKAEAERLDPRRGRPGARHRVPPAPPDLRPRGTRT